MRKFDTQVVDLVKAASKRVFAIDRKFERVANLIVAYVWYLETPEKAIAYALTWKEAFEIAKTKKYVKAKSWTEDGYFVNTTPGAELCRLLAPYEMTPDKWYRKVVGRRANLN